MGRGNTNPNSPHNRREDTVASRANTRDEQRKNKTAVETPKAIDPDVQEEGRHHPNDQRDYGGARQMPKKRRAHNLT